MAPNKRNWNLALTLRDGSATGRSTYRFALPVTNDVMADRDPFTVRSSTSNSLSSLTDYGAIAQQSFHNGVGFDKLTDTSGYKFGQSVDARIPGITTIFPGPRVIPNMGVSPVRWNSSLEQVVPMCAKTLFSNSYVRILIGGEGGVRAVNPIPYDSWTASTVYKKHDIILPTVPANHIYVCRVAGTSGSSQPSWSTSAGSTNTDGTVTWVAQNMTYIHDIKWSSTLTNEYSVMDMWGNYRPLVGLFGEVMLKFTGNMDRYEGIWSPNRPYQLGDFVTRTSHAGFFFEATTVASNGFSGASEPSWNATIGGTVTDGDITWTTRAYWERVNGEDSWSPSTTYDTGDIVRPRTLTSSITGFYYEQTNQAASGLGEPTWSTTIGGTTTDGSITWETRQYDAWEATHNYEVGDRVRKATTPANYFFEVVAISGDGLSGETEPTWDNTVNNQTTDNQVTWKTYRPVWTTGGDHSIGDIITAATTPAGSDSFYFYATAANAGASGASEPTWPTTEGGTVADGGGEWTARLERDAPKDAGVFTDFDGYIFYNQHFLTGSDNARVLVGSLVHYFASTDGQDAAGFTNEDDTHPLFRTQGDPGAIQVGTAYKRVRKLVPFNQALYALCSDAIYYIQQVDGVFEARRLDIGGIGLQAHRDNFVIGLEWNGALWFNIRNKLYRYSGSNLADATPPIYDREVYPPSRPLRLHSAVGVGRFLYVVADDDLWCTDGTAWHRLSRIPDSANYIVQATIGWQEANYNNPAHLFVMARTAPVGQNIGSNGYEEAAGETSQFYFWSFGEDTDYPIQDTFRNNYSSDTIGELITAKLDGGFETVQKAWLSLKVKAGFYNAPISPTLNGWSDARVEVYATTSGSGTTEMTGGGELNELRIDRNGSSEARLGLAYNLGVRGLTASGPDYLEVVRELLIPFQPDNNPTMYDDPFTAALGMTFTFKLKAGTLSTSRTPVLPVLLGYESRLVVRPETTFGLQVTLPIADNMMRLDGARNHLSAKEMKEVLLEARDSVIPIYIDDLVHDKSGWFYVSKIQKQPLGKNENYRATEGVEEYAVLSFVEIIYNTDDEW